MGNLTFTSHAMVFLDFSEPKTVKENIVVEFEDKNGIKTISSLSTKPYYKPLTKKDIREAVEYVFKTKLPEPRIEKENIYYDNI